MKHFNLLLIGQDPLRLKKLSNYLSGDDCFFITATAFSKIEALNLVKDMNFDVALIYISLGYDQEEGIHTIAKILLYQDLKVIVISDSAEEELVIKAFTAGAVYFLEESQLANLKTAIKLSCSKVTPLEIVLEDYLRLKKEEQLKALTPAEYEIFTLIEQGFTQSQIAQSLHKTKSTLKNQINRILKKLEVANTKAAVKKVQTRGLLH